MTQLDLIHYTNCKAKVSPQELGHFANQKNEIKSFNKLAAYFLDTIATLSVATTMALLFKFSFSQLVMTDGFKNTLLKMDFSDFSMRLMPLFFVSYFFFSFFFNNGQTWGMSVQKSRIEMMEMNFRSSLFWALYSSVVVMSGGLAYFMTYNLIKDKGWGSFQSHDHLYLELLQDRDLAPINLVAKIEADANAADHEEYLEAA